MTGLELVDVTKRFGGITAVDGFNAEVDTGEVVGLIGPNGAGKSTVVNMLAGSFRPSRGRIILDGQEITTWQAHRRARAGVFRTYQTPRLFRRLSVAENVRLAAHSCRRRHDDGLDFDEVVEGLQLADDLQRSVDSLNIVSRHRIEIARCLLASPRLLLLDEPTAGMSAEDAEATLAVIRSWQPRVGFGVLLIEHNLALVSAATSRLLVLNFGRSIAGGLTADVLEDEGVVTAYLGGAA